MKKADRPIDSDDDKVDQREEENKCLVGRFCRILLVLIRASSESDISEEYGIGQDSSNNEGIVDEDPSCESSDSSSNRRA